MSVDTSAPPATTPVPPLSGAAAEPTHQAPAPAPKSSQGECACAKTVLTLHNTDLSDGTPRGWLCHCATCRRSTGTDYAHNLQVKTESLQLHHPERLTRYTGRNRDTGVAFTRLFCTACGSTVTSTPAPVEAAGYVIVRLGLFPDIPPPAGERFADDKARWIRARIPDFGRDEVMSNKG